MVSRASAPDTQDTGILGVDTFQITVPGGDCAIYLLVDGPPRCVGSNFNFKGPGAGGKYGKVLKAILVDGGHDGRPGYYGEKAAKAIGETILDIQKRYFLPNKAGLYDGKDNGLTFDAWIISHWDRDHYCGALHLFWQYTKPKEQCPFMKYDGEGKPLTTLYCPTWDAEDIAEFEDGKSISSKGHHPMLGETSSPDTCFLYLPVGPNPLARRDEEYHDNLSRSVALMKIVQGKDNLLGLDFFSRTYFVQDDTGAKDENNEYILPNVVERFVVNFENDGYPYALAADAKLPVLVCVGSSGYVLGRQRAAISHATADNYVSIMMVLVWLPRLHMNIGRTVVSLFSGGDAHSLMEELLIGWLDNHRVEVVKAGHHGARTSTSARFLNALRPNKIVVSAGTEYGHPSWQLLALLWAYHAGRRSAGDHDTYEKKNIFADQEDRLCQTTRYPYYLLALEDPSAFISAKQLNMLEYLNHSESYDAFYNSCGTVENLSIEEGDYEHFWGVIKGTTDDPNADLYESLLGLPAGAWELQLLHADQMGYTLGKFFYAYRAQHFNSPNRPDNQHMGRALIRLLRFVFGDIAPYFPSYNKLRYLIIHSRHEQELDGSITRIHSDKKIEVTPPKPKVGSRTQGEVDMRDAVDTRTRSGDWELRLQFIRTFEANRFTPETGLKKALNFEFDFSKLGQLTSVDTVVQIKPEQLDELAAELAANFPLSDYDETDVPQDKIETRRLTDHLQELEYVNDKIHDLRLDKDGLLGLIPPGSHAMGQVAQGPSDGQTGYQHGFSFAQGPSDGQTGYQHGFSSAQGPSDEQTGYQHGVSFVGGPLDGLPDFHPGGSYTNMAPARHALIQPTKDSPFVQIGNPNDPDFLAMAPPSLAPKPSRKPEVFEYTATATSSVARDGARICGIILLSDDKDSSLDKPRRSSGFASLPAGSKQFALWPGTEFCFDPEPAVPLSQSGRFAAALSADDALVRRIAQYLIVDPGQEGSESFLEQIELACTSLPGQANPNGPYVEVNELTVTLSVGASRIDKFVFSTEPAAISDQFSRNASGMSLRPDAVLLGLKEFADPGPTELTMSDVFALAGFRAAKWVDDVLGLIPVQPALHHQPGQTTPCRNGLWLQPVDGFEAILRLQFKLGRGIAKISDLLGGQTTLFDDLEFDIIVRRGVAMSRTSEKKMRIQPMVALRTSVVLPSGHGRPGEPAVSAVICITADGVDLHLVRVTESGSMANLFRWLADSFSETSNLGGSVGAFKESLEKATKVGADEQTQTAEASSEGFDISWRYFSMSIEHKSIVDVQACFEVDMAIGVKKGQTACFTLELTWKPWYWQVQAMFMPGGNSLSWTEDRFLNPWFESWESLPPLKANRAESMSILHLGPSGFLKEGQVPYYVPTEIVAASISLSSRDAELSAILTSAAALRPPQQDGSVPMIAIDSTALCLRATYGFGTGAQAGFSFAISGFLYLTDPAAQDEKSSGAVSTGSKARPRLTAAISYTDKVWSFGASANDIRIASLLSMFGDSIEQAEVKEFLGHVVLKELSFAYEYRGDVASGLSLLAKVAFSDYIFKLTYTRGTRAATSSKAASSGWSLRMQLSKKLSSKEVTVGETLDWLVGDSLRDSLPDFLANTSFRLDEARFGFSCERAIASDKSSTLTVSAEFHIGGLAVHLARIQKRPAGTRTPAAQSKTVVRVTLDALPRPPPIPIFGQLDQPFRLELRYLGSDLSSQDIEILNSSADCFRTRGIQADADENRDAACGKGFSFALFAGEKQVVSSRPRQPTPKDKAVGAKPPVPNTGKEPGQAANPPERAAGEDDEKKSGDMKPHNISMNAVSITNVGLDFKSKEQKLVIKFNATAQLGQLTAELIGFALEVDFSRCKGLHPREWTKLQLQPSLSGLALALDGPTLTVAGFLERVNDIKGQVKAVGFKGGVTVKVSAYSFTAFGSYETIETTADDGSKGEFTSLMVYALLQGTLLKTPFIEIRGICGGFGYGSQLTLPAVTELAQFPLLADREASAVAAFRKLRGGASGGPKYIRPMQGSLWFAVGILATAMETVDVRALLTVQLSPTVQEIGILGSAAVCLPRGKPAKEALALIELDFVGKIDVANGSFRFDGQISPRSFLLDAGCRPTGGFTVCAWFGSSPHSGDWCVSVGGWHPAYHPPAHYPPPPPRLGIAWRYSDALSITGHAYAAVTPDALMGGAVISVVFALGKVSARFDAHVDFIMQLLPLHYSATCHVSAAVSYEARVWCVAKKISVTLGATLSLSGPPFAGTAHFDVCVYSFDVRFGDFRNAGEPKALTLGEFVDALQKKDGKSKSDVPDHVLSLESGAVTSGPQEGAAQTHDTPWVVRGADFVLTATSRVAMSTVDVKRGRTSDGQQDAVPIYARPMRLPAGSEGLRSALTVTVRRKGSNTAVVGFRFERITESVPTSLWGPYSADKNAMLMGSNRPSTVARVMGVRIRAPTSEWSTLDPSSMVLADLVPADPTTVVMAREAGSEVAFGAKFRSPPSPGQPDQGDAAHFKDAKRALLGLAPRGRGDPHASQQRGAAVQVATSVLELSERRAAIVRGWRRARGLKQTPGDGARGKVPIRYAKRLDEFCHAPPRLTIG